MWMFTLFCSQIFIERLLLSSTKTKSQSTFFPSRGSTAFTTSLRKEKAPLPLIFLSSFFKTSSLAFVCFTTRRFYFSFLFDHSIFGNNSTMSAFDNGKQEGDWKDNCVKPPKDTRVQTEVSAPTLLVLWIGVIFSNIYTGCYCHQGSRVRRLRLEDRTFDGYLRERFREAFPNSGRSHSYHLGWPWCFSQSQERYWKDCRFHHSMLRESWHQHQQDSRWVDSFIIFSCKLPKQYVDLNDV